MLVVLKALGSGIVEENPFTAQYKYHALTTPIIKDFENLLG